MAKNAARTPVQSPMTLQMEVGVILMLQLLRQLMVVTVVGMMQVLQALRGTTRTTILLGDFSVKGRIHGS